MGVPDDRWTPEYLREDIKRYRLSPAKAKLYLLKTVILVEKLINAKTDRGRISAWKKIKAHLVGPYNDDMSYLLGTSVIQHLPERYWAEEVKIKS